MLVLRRGLLRKVCLILLLLIVNVLSNEYPVHASEDCPSQWDYIISDLKQYVKDGDRKLGIGYFLVGQDGRVYDCLGFVRDREWFRRHYEYFADLIFVTKIASEKEGKFYQDIFCSLSKHEYKDLSLNYFIFLPYSWRGLNEIECREKIINSILDQK